MKNIGGNPVFLEPEFDSKTRSVALSIVPSEGSSYICQDVRKRFTRTSFGQPRRELKPGEDVIMRREDLRHWYIPTSDGHYHFICTYNRSIYDHIDTSNSVWDGYLAAELSVAYSK